jgi:hypothetical protein
LEAAKGETTMQTIEQLMDERHEAYQRALATGFHKFIQEFRAANSRYVLARDAMALQGVKTMLAA